MASSPGATISEKRKGPVTLPGTSTAIGGFYGITEKGVADTPTLIGSMTDYEEVFGTRPATTYVYDAVSMFFKQGGKSCYVARVPAASGSASASAVSAAKAGGGGTTLTYTASSFGAWANKRRLAVTLNDTTVSTCGANSAGATTTLVVTTAARISVGDQISVTKAADVQRSVVTAIDGTSLTLATSITIPGGGYSTSESVVVETFNVELFDTTGKSLVKHTNLRMSSLAGANYVVYKIGQYPRTDITVASAGQVPSSTIDPRPAATVTNLALTSGADGAAPTDTEYKGTLAGKTGIYCFDKVKDVNFISEPGVTSTAVVQEMQVYAELRQDVVIIFEPPQGYTAAQYKTWIQTTTNVASSYMAVYWPWVKIQDPVTLAEISIPPSGLVQGIIARVHAKRNFGKAPAGIPDALINGILGVDTEVLEGSSDYDSLYPYGLNAILNFPGEGRAIWGSRTLDPTGEFGQISHRIVFNTAKRQLKILTRFVNFENNNTTTRGGVERVAQGLFRGWRESGILAGESDDEAFFIICDDTNNTALVRKQGKLVGRFGLATENPSEFIEFTLEQDTRAVDAELAGL